MKHANALIGCIATFIFSSGPQYNNGIITYFRPLNLFFEANVRVLANGALEI